MLQIYRRKPLLNSDFNKVCKGNFIEYTHRHKCSPVCCIFLEHLFIRTTMECCFCAMKIPFAPVALNCSNISFRTSFFSIYLDLKLTYENTNAQKINISIKDFFSECDQIHGFLRIWSHLLKKSLIEKFIFCAVHFAKNMITFT